jgi:hypothetical protein
MYVGDATRLYVGEQLTFGFGREYVLRRLCAGCARAYDTRRRSQVRRAWTLGGLVVWVVLALVLLGLALR